MRIPRGRNGGSGGEDKGIQKRSQRLEIGRNIKNMEVTQMAWNLSLAREPPMARVSNLLFASWAHLECEKRNLNGILSLQELSDKKDYYLGDRSPDSTWAP